MSHEDSTPKSESEPIKIGDRFGRLVVRVAARIPAPRKNKPHNTIQAFQCDCDCGITYTVSKYALREGNTKSCGCLLAQSALQAGKRIGWWTVIKSVSRSQTGHRQVECRCDCGKVKILLEGNLKARRKRGIMSLSCGCMKSELIGIAGTTHGHTRRGVRSDEFVIWTGILQRCTNPNALGYKNYGGRGIGVCKRWADSFEAFFCDMGPRPSADHGIDRKENDGGYWCGSKECAECGQFSRRLNCRWATRSENQNNRRCNIRLEHDGKNLTVAEWSEATGIKWSTIRERMKRGWSTKKILTTQVGSQRSNQGK